MWCIHAICGDDAVIAWKLKGEQVVDQAGGVRRINGSRVVLQVSERRVLRVGCEYHGPWLKVEADRWRRPMLAMMRIAGSIERRRQADLYALCANFAWASVVRVMGGSGKREYGHEERVDSHHDVQKMREEMGSDGSMYVFKRHKQPP